MSHVEQILDRADQVISETVVANARIITESRWHGDPWNCRRLHVFDASSDLAFDVTERTFPEDMPVEALSFHARLEESARTRGWIASRIDLSPALLLAAWRTVEDLTIDDAAAKLGVHRSTWGSWERQERKPDDRRRKELQDLTGIPAARWEYGQEEPEAGS